jgi:predicted nucleotide-binding protein (sugar kinase/HSP70/actin superfamily)
MMQGFYFNHVEHGLYEIARDIIHDRPEPRIEDIVEAGMKYIPVEFEGESILTVGRALIFIEKEGVDAVVNVSPTFCMPGTITTAIFARIEDEKGVPIICNFYDGSGEPNKVLRPHLHCLTRK